MASLEEEEDRDMGGMALTPLNGWPIDLNFIC
jgi:hypothetical protein